MRTATLMTALACLASFSAASFAADPAKAPVVLQSSHFSPGLPLGESRRPIYAISLQVVDADEAGEGRGVLFLNPNPPEYDEYGDFMTGDEIDANDAPAAAALLPTVRVDCTVRFVKKGEIRRVNQPSVPRLVFGIKGPQVISSLLLASEGPGLKSGRLLVQGKGGKVQHVVDMTEVKPAEEGLPVPCHPGCFPAGTRVLVPDGAEAIERVRVGDDVTTVGPDGTAARGTVESLFTTTNRLVEVRTDLGPAVATDAQPFSLAAGGFRRAGNLKAGDRVWRWRDGRRVAAVVRGVTPTGREGRVFNLVMTDSAVFVAEGFLVRGKPPLAAAPAQTGKFKNLPHAPLAPPPAPGAGPRLR